MPRSKTVARFYRAINVKIAEVKMTVLKLEKEVDYGSADVLDVISDLHERYSRTSGYVVEVIRFNHRGEEVEAAGFATVDGVILFPRPAKLISLRIIEDGVDGALPLDKLRRARPREEFYVSIGKIELPKGVWGVAIETDRGFRIVTKSSLRG